MIPWAQQCVLALESFSVGGVDCPQTPSGSTCKLGDLPANSAIPVSAIFRALAGEAYTGAVLDVYQDRDSNSANNNLAIPIYTLDRSDIQLSVAQTSVTAVNGTVLQFPRITVNNGASDLAGHHGRNSVAIVRHRELGVGGRHLQRHNDSAVHLPGGRS